MNRGAVIRIRRFGIEIIAYVFFISLNCTVGVKIGYCAYIVFPESYNCRFFWIYFNIIFGFWFPSVYIKLNGGIISVIYTKCASCPNSSVRSFIIKKKNIFGGAVKFQRISCFKIYYCAWKTGVIFIVNFISVRFFCIAVIISNYNFVRFFWTLCLSYCINVF